MADYNSSYTGAQIDANLAKAATAVQPTNNATALGSGSATNGQVLSANGSGGTTWATASGGGGTPGGSDTQVQFNDGGAFGGDSGFTFDKTNNTLGLGGGTITASDPIIDMAQTWNNAAVAFTAIKANVTDTASAAGSLLMDLQVGGVSQFKVSKTGAVTTPGSLNAGVDIYWTRDLYALSGTSRITWSGNLSLHQDAANTLAQRNGVNAQAFNLYNTYTDASNYERGFMRFVSNVLQIGAEKLGTGTARALAFQTDGVTRLTIAANGALNATSTLEVGGGTIAITSNNAVMWGSGAYGWIAGNAGAASAPDLTLLRDAADNLAQRRGTNAQTSRLYGTYTDASNYRRLTKTMSTAGVAEIKPEGAGTGASGNVLHISGLPTANPGPGILWNNAGTPAIGT